MWDSFESVYLAAKQDPQCDVYCVPIPYYDRLSTNKLGPMHYEGYSYPDNVEVTDWRAYNVKEHHPDIIFLHNPYDNINIVTSVHPDYYTWALRRYTNYLVYIDYGIPMHIFKKPMKYEAILPGWFNVDLFCAYSKEYAENQTYAMEIVAPHMTTKVIGIGSPKFDKVLHSVKEDFDLPQEWNEIIKGRKAILFNTALSGILNDTQSYLFRLSEILRIFKSTKEIGLWWRPHPLTFETIQRMRPELAITYREIVEKYRQDGWGIYDESADIHRAIAYTDAYYGDLSSIVYLYCATGKPFSIGGIPHQCYMFTEDTERFDKALDWRINNMQSADGANIDGYNTCIWWGNFFEDLDYGKFLRLFLDYVVNTDQYPQADLYQRLQIELFKKYVVNSDGTAGAKIYDYCKRKVLEDLK